MKAQDDEFVGIYKRNINMVYRLCFIFLKNTADADDAVQSIFLKILKHKIVFNNYEHEKAWLVVATRNHCKDVLKSWWKSRRVDLAALPDKTYWENNEKDKEVLERLLLLPEKYRTILYLYYIEGYSIKEISKLFNRRESTIQTQLSRGRERLKADMGGKHIDREASHGTI